MAQPPTPFIFLLAAKFQVGINSLQLNKYGAQFYPASDNFSSRTLTGSDNSL